MWGFWGDALGWHGRGQGPYRVSSSSLCRAWHCSPRARSARCCSVTSSSRCRSPRACSSPRASSAVGPRGQRGHPDTPNPPGTLLKGRAAAGPLVGVTGGLYPMPLLPGVGQMDAGDGQRDTGDGQVDAGDRQTSPCRAALPRASSARSRRRATSSSPSAVTLTSSLAWGEGTRRCGDRGGTASSGLCVLCQSPVPPHHCPVSPSCPQAPGGFASPHHVSQRSWDMDLGKILSQRDAHPGEDAGAPRMSQVTQVPHGWHPRCQGGDRGRVSCVPDGCTAQPHSQPHSWEAGAFFQPLQTIVRPDGPGGAAGPGSSSRLCRGTGARPFPSRGGS